MPSRREHDEKVRRNTDVTQFLQTTSRYNEWVAVTAFYTIIHMIDKFFARNRVQIVTSSPSPRPPGEPQTHKERRDTLFGIINRGVLQNRGLKSKYNSLYNASRIARYQSMADFNRQYTNRIQDLLNMVDDFRNSLS